MSGAPFQDTNFKNYRFYYIGVVIGLPVVLVTLAYTPFLIDIDEELFTIKGCKQVFDYVNSHDESLITKSTAKWSMEMLSDCQDLIKDGQSIKIIKESRIMGKNGLDSNIRVEYTGFNIP